MEIDAVIKELAGYICREPDFSDEAYATARMCLADSFGCALLALKYPACTKLLGPVIPGTVVPNGARVIGTDYVLDPIRAAFNIGTMIRWLDYNDTWLAAEWGHPSDNLGGLLSILDFLSQKQAVPVKTLLDAMIQAHEIQGVLALGNSFNRIGFDHVILVKIATAGVVAKLLGANQSQVEDALSHAFLDAGPLRTYRHAPNTGPRKSWAAGDATSRGVQLAWMVMQGEEGYKKALTAKGWGFNEVMLPVTLARPLGCYVMEHVLFKISYPAEFHAQTAVEAAVTLSKQVDISQIVSIDIATHESALRIIDKTGPLKNPADRDHCMQYMVAVALLKGSLAADDYEDAAANNPVIDQLRSKMRLTENPRFSKEYLDPSRRSIANAITIVMQDGSIVGPVIVEYPLGHKRRREEAKPLLFKKFLENSENETLLKLFQDPERLDATPVHLLVEST